MRKRKRLVLMITLLLAAYSGLYVWLSRRGYAEADQYNMHGFYYFLPENSDAWRYRNQAFIFLFWPLNMIDQSLGTGRHPAYEPLWGLTK